MINFSDDSVSENSFNAIPNNRCRLVYPTRETVPVCSRVVAHVDLGKYSVDLPFYVSHITDDCLLGRDFLMSTNLESSFRSVLGISHEKEDVSFGCARVKDCEVEVPPFLEELFGRDSCGLDPDKKQEFARILEEFQDVFSEEIVAGCCGMVEHKIELADPQPIKQAPRRIPIHLRREVDKILEEMKDAKIIEESQSPWVSPADGEKKRWFPSFLC
ncbi:hypothetical protein X777_04315 [Ooceraea biroi]|uniref:Uncharacterized protein n=1 Tax=Ooceraea biroi TaxID=2015173 RepID=A0A026WI57_OOCBI|nr:hypothetical protein X777_04315 [Ooceraea biroi]